MPAPRDLGAIVSAREPDEQNLAFKEEVFAGVLRWFSGGAVAIVVIMLTQGLRGKAMSTSLLVACGMVALLPGFLLVRRALGYPRTAVLFLGYLLLVCTYGQCERGLTPGVAMAMVAFLLLAGMFFGSRGVRWAFSASLASLASSALVSTSGYASDWEREYWDPHQPLVWLRYAAVLFFFGGALLSAFTKLIEGLARSNAALQLTLERELAERQQLERTQGALEQAQRLEALAQYAGGLAHDFNNNLMVIVGGAALIADDDQAGEQVRATARDIAKSAETGAEMVQHLLSLGQKRAAAPQRIQAEAVVQQCRGTLRKVLPATVQLQFDVDPEAELSVDVARLQQAILNLALNARDALGDTGKFKLRVARRTVSEPPAHGRARPGTFVVISCEDSGTGMDEATRARLFEPFFTTKAAGKGTGLGLATVQRFVEDAGGFITVDTEPGRGTAFHLHLPVANAGPRSQPSPSGQVEQRPTETR
jgi:signal transduction histidine kinase